MEELPLPSLFHRALTAASKALNLPTIEDETQASEKGLHACLLAHTKPIGTHTIYARGPPSMQLARCETIPL